MYEQARPSASGSFSARFARAITRGVIGLLHGNARGGTPFRCGETSGGALRCEMREYAVV